jgi:Cu+-exporting ATPase
VISIAVITFIAWYFLGPQPNMAYALTTGIAVLVIACPCALGLATPIAIMMGTGKAAQYNILIKNSDALQTASTLTHLVVDKTGTLTQGKPVLTQLTAYHTDESTVLQLAASLEQYSEHPLAKTILDAAEHRGIELVVIDDFQAVQGRGVKGSYKEQTLILGNRLFLQEHQIDISDKNESDTTTIWLAMLHPSQEENQLAGQLILEDPIRSDSLTAITQLKKQNIEVVMCTGDSSNAASSVAQALGISQIHSELLPEDKLNVIEQLQSQGYIVGMVGDGINDAPALAKANTGFAIGSGTDVAIENADITLAGNSLTNVCTAIAISSATIKNIKQNLFGAFIYNIIGIPLAAGFFYPITGWLLAPAFASAAMAMSSVTVVVNANRLRFFKSN